MRKCINLLACILVLGGLCVLSAPAAPKSEPATVRELYVPFDDLNILLENQPQRVMLSRREFAELLAQSKHTPTSAAPVAAVLLSGAYQINVDQERASIEGRLDLEVLVDGVQALPLDLAEVALTRAMLDGHSAAIGQIKPAKPMLLVEGQGRHTLTLGMVTPLTTTAAEQTLSFQVPATATTTLQLTVPGDVEIKSGTQVIQRVFDPAARQTRFDLLATQSKTTIVMTLNSHLLRTQRVVVAKAVVVDEVTQSYERLHATFSMAVLHKAVDSFRLTIPAGFEVTQVQSPLMARWSIAPAEQGRRILEISLREPTSQTEVLSLAAIRAAPPPEAWTFPMIEALDVSGEVAVIGLLLEERMKAQSIESTGLIPIDTSVLTQALPASVFQAEPGAPRIRPVAAYYAPQTSFRLAASFQKPSSRLLVTTSVLLTLSDKQQQVRAGFTLLPELDRLFAVDVELPEAWRVTQVTDQAGAALPLERFPGRIHLRLPKSVPVGETFTFHVQADCTPAGWLTDWNSTEVAAPLLRITGATRETGALAVAVEGDLTVRPQKLEQLIPIDETEKPGYGLAGVASSLAYRFDAVGYHADLVVQRIVPRLTARTYSFLSLQPELLSAHYELVYEVEDAKVQRVSLILPATTPETLSIQGLDGVALKEFTSRVEGGLRHWSVLLEEARRDTIRLAVDFQQPLGPEVKEYTLPVIQAEQLAHQSGFVAVEGSAELDVKVATSLRKVDVGELAGTKYEPGKRLLGAFAFVGESPDLRVSISRPVSHDLPSALIERAELVTVLGSQGLSQHAAALSLRSKDPYLEIELPAGATLWSAQVDGATIKPQRQDQRLLLTLPPATGAVRHDLRFVYELPMAPGSFRQHVEVPAPRFVLRATAQGDGLQVPVAGLTWHVFLPEGYRVTHTDGTVASSSIPTEELAITRLSRQLYGWMGGVHLFYVDSLVGVQGKRESEVSLSNVVTLGDAVDVSTNSFFATPSPALTVDELKADGRPAEQTRRQLGIEQDHAEALQGARAYGGFGGAGRSTGKPAAMAAGGQQVEGQPSEPDASVVTRHLWSLQGVRSLKIGLEQAGPRITFSSLGVDPRVSLTLLDEHRSNALAWGLACVVALWGVRGLKRPLRARMKLILLVASIATLVPLISGSVMLTRVLNPSFMVAAGLIPFYLVVALLRCAVHAWRVPLSTPVTAAIIAVCMLAPLQSARADTPTLPMTVELTEPHRPVSVPDDAIIVPYDPTAPITTDDLQRILVPYRQYVELWNGAHPDQAANLKPPPAAYAFAGVILRSTLEGEDYVVIEAQAELEVYTSGTIHVPLPLENGVLMQAELDGRPARLGTMPSRVQPATRPAAAPPADSTPVLPPATDTLVVSVSGKGRHVLKLSAQMRLERSGGWRILHGRLLDAPAATLALTVPAAQTELRLAGIPDRTGYVTTAPQETISTALAADGNISLQWRPKVSEGVVDQTLTAQSTALFDVQEDGVRLVWRLALEFRRGERAVFQVDLPAGYLVTRVVGENVRGWETEALTAGSRLRVTLLKPAKDREQFDIHLSRRGPVGSAEWTQIEVPCVSMADASLHHGSIFIRRSPLLELRSADVQGVARMDIPTGAAIKELTLNVDSPLGLKPFVAYQFAAVPWSVRLTAAPVAQHVSARVQTILRIAQRERSLETRINLDVQDRPLYQAAMLLPGELDLEHVSAPGAFEWSVTPQQGQKRLDIVLTAGATGEVAIVVRGRLGEYGLLDRVSLPVLEVLDVQQQDGEIAVQADPGWRVEPVDLHGCETIQLGRVHAWLTPAQRALTRAALHYGKPDYRGSVRLTALTPLVHGQTISNVRITDRAIEETILLDFDIQRSGLRELSFQLPESLKDARIRVPQLRQQTVEPAGADAPGMVRVRLSLQDKVMGHLRVLVESDRALSLGRHQVPIPVLEGMVATQRYALIENAGRYEVESEAQGLTALSRQQSEWQRLTGILGGNITSAYIADSAVKTPVLAFQTRDRAIVETVGARIGLAQATIVVDAGGTYRAVQSYRVDNRTEQTMEIRLPAGADVWTVQVAGEPVKPAQSPDPGKTDRLLVPLVKTAAGDLDYEVVIKYGGRLDDLGRLSTVNFPLIRPININAELSQVRLYLPERYRWLDFGGTMSRSKDDAGLTSGFISYQTKRAQRLIQAMGDSSSFTRLRAASNLQVLKSEVQKYQQTAQPADSDGDLKLKWEDNQRILEGAVKQSEEVNKELSERQSLGDNRGRLGSYYFDQGAARPKDAVQPGTVNFIFDANQPVLKNKGAPTQEGAEWFRSNSLVTVDALQEAESAQAPANRGKGELVARQPVRTAQKGERKLNLDFGQNYVPQQPAASPQQPAAPQVISQPRGLPAGEQKQAGADKKVRSGEALGQYQQALQARNARAGTPTSNAGTAIVDGNADGVPDAGTERLGRRAGGQTDDSTVDFNAVQQAGLPSGLASLDVDIQPSGVLYRFTAPLGETTITARAVSQRSIHGLERFGWALLLVAVGWVVYKLSAAAGSVLRRRWGWLLALGLLSLVGGVLPLAGVALVVLGLVLRAAERRAPGAFWCASSQTL